MTSHSLSPSLPVKILVGTGISVMFSALNTDENWSLNFAAICVTSLISFPSGLTSGPTLILVLALHLTYAKKDFLSSLILDPNLRSKLHRDWWIAVEASALAFVHAGWEEFFYFWKILCLCLTALRALWDSHMDLPFLHFTFLTGTYLDFRSCNVSLNKHQQSSTDLFEKSTCQSCFASSGLILHEAIA